MVMDRAEFEQTLSGLGIGFRPKPLESAQLAGRLFRQRRRTGGPRGDLVPGFFIGARARRRAEQIAAIDRGYLRRTYPRLKVLRPR